MVTRRSTRSAVREDLVRWDSQLLQLLTHWFAVTNFYPEWDSRGCGFISVSQ